jgi:hypothetical protein
MATCVWSRRRRALSTPGLFAGCRGNASVVRARSRPFGASTPSLPWRLAAVVRVLRSSAESAEDLRNAYFWSDGGGHSGRSVGRMHGGPSATAAGSSFSFMLPHAHHAPPRPTKLHISVSISPPIRLDVRTPALRVLFLGPHARRKHCDKRRHRRPRSQSAFRRRRCSDEPARPSAYRAVVQLLLGRRRLAGGARSARAQRVLSGRGQPSARPHRAKEAR